MSNQCIFKHPFTSKIVRLEVYFKQRISEFEKLGREGFTTFNFSPFLNLKIDANLMSELAFCISTANSSAISGLKFQKSIERKNPEKLSINELEYLLKNSGVRFYRKKAVFIKEALDNFDFSIDFSECNEKSREWIAKNIKGLGFKEASHFLRNVGNKDFAIIDRHIMKYLVENGYMDNKSITPCTYLRCEEILKKIASTKKISLAELDLEIWYQKTGKVLK